MKSSRRRSATAWAHRGKRRQQIGAAGSRSIIVETAHADTHARAEPGNRTGDVKEMEERIRGARKEMAQKRIDGLWEQAQKAGFDEDELAAIREEVRESSYGQGPTRFCVQPRINCTPRPRFSSTSSWPTHEYTSSLFLRAPMFRTTSPPSAAFSGLKP